MEYDVQDLVPYDGFLMRMPAEEVKTDTRHGARGLLFERRDDCVSHQLHAFRASSSVTGKRL